MPTDPKPSPPAPTGGQRCPWCGKTVPPEGSAYTAEDFEACPHCYGSFSYAKPAPPPPDVEEARSHRWHEKTEVHMSGPKRRCVCGKLECGLVPAPSAEPTRGEERRVQLCHHGRKITCLECADEGPQEEEYLLRADRIRLTNNVRVAQERIAALEQDNARLIEEKEQHRRNWRTAEGALAGRADERAAVVAYLSSEKGGQQSSDPIEQAVELCQDAMAIFDGENLERVRQEFRQILRETWSKGAVAALHRWSDKTEPYMGGTKRRCVCGKLECEVAREALRDAE